MAKRKHTIIPLTDEEGEKGQEDGKTAGNFEGLQGGRKCVLKWQTQAKGSDHGERERVT